jgi:ribosomal protein S12 methylthiotransferase accessory factor
MKEQPCLRSFADAPDVEHATVAEDVRWICDALRSAGLTQIFALDLTRSDLAISVIRVIVPFLEAMSELPGYVPGERARRAMEGRA